MNIKKIALIVFLSTLVFHNVQSIEPDIFVQSTVNRASKLLSEDISKEEKIIAVSYTHLTLPTILLV